MPFTKERGRAFRNQYHASQGREMGRSMHARNFLSCSSDRNYAEIKLYAITQL